jgi:hypothetical protein
MENYVNLTGLQDSLENLLFSVRYINSDHQDTALTVDDFESFELKAKQLLDEINSLLNLNSPNDTAKQVDQIQNLYEANHIKEARLKIFTTVLNVIVSHQKEIKQDLTDEHLKAVLEITNDSMKLLYKVNL